MGLDSAGHLKAFYLVCGSQKPEREATDSFNRVSLQLERKKKPWDWPFALDSPNEWLER